MKKLAKLFLVIVFVFCCIGAVTTISGNTKSKGVVVLAEQPGNNSPSAYISQAQADECYTKGDLVRAATSTGWTTKAQGYLTLVFKPSTAFNASTANNVTTNYCCGNAKNYLMIGDSYATSNMYPVRWDSSGDSRMLTMNLNGNQIAEGQKVTIKAGFVIGAWDGSKAYAFEVEHDYVFYKVNGYYLPEESVDDIKSDNGYALSERPITFNGISFSGNSLKLNTSDNGYVNANPAGAASYIDLSRIQINGVSANTLDKIWYGQIEGNTNPIVGLYGNKDTKIAFEEGDIITFKKGFTMLFPRSDGNNYGTWYKFVSTAPYTAKYTSGSFVTCDDPYGPPQEGTPAWYVYTAKENSQYHAFEPAFAMTYHSTWLGTDENIPWTFVNVGEDISLEKSNVSYIENRGKIFVSDSYDSEGSVASNATVTYLQDNRAGQSFVAMKFNNLSGKPKRITLKEGFVIVLTNGDTYALEKDCPLYNVNGSYVLAKTPEEMIAKAESEEMVAHKNSVGINSISIDKTSLKITYSSNISLVGYTNTSYVSWDKIVGSKGGKVTRSYQGGMNSGTKDMSYSNFSHTFTAGELVTVKAGFTTIFWQNNQASVDIITTSQDESFYYNGQDFIKCSELKTLTPLYFMPYYNTGWGMGANDTLLGIAIKEADGASLQGSNITYCKNNGFVYTASTYDGEPTLYTGNVEVFNASRGGANWALLKMSGTKPQKVVLKAGFVIVANGIGYQLQADTTLYNVCGTLVQGKTAEEALSNAQDGVVKYYDCTVSEVTFSGTDLRITYSGLSLEGVGAPALVTSDKFYGYDGGKVSSFGGYADQNKKTIQYSNASHTFTEGEILALEAGFTSVFTAENNSKLYAVRTTKDAYFHYEDGKFVAFAPSVTIKGGEEDVVTPLAPNSDYVLPSIDEIPNKLLLGYTDGQNYYKVGDTLENVTEEITLTAVWTEYSIVDGASIRLVSDLSTSGIRFAVSVTEDANIVGAGVLVMPYDFLNDNEFTKENYLKDTASESALDFYWEKSTIDFTAGDGKATLYASVVNLHEENYTRKFVARAYLVYNFGGEEITVYCTLKDSNIRSIYEVAQATLQDDNNGLSQSQIAIVESYVKASEPQTSFVKDNLVCKTEFVAPENTSDRIFVTGRNAVCFATHRFAFDKTFVTTCKEIDKNEEIC